MHHPYQCIEICRYKVEHDRNIVLYLLAASGSRLYSLQIDGGAIVSSWPKENIEDAWIGGSTEIEPASKRRKISATPDEPPNITNIKVTSDGKYAIITTAEDKAVIVFEISPEGQLHLLSRRCMPKRPCTIDLDPNDRTIIIGDKFGDVYSLPLFPKLHQENAESPEQTAVPIPLYRPAATEKTVHSKANLRVLQEQLRQAEQGVMKKSKEPLAFEHELLLGHVSMLTDLVVTSHKAEDKTAKARTYILTADRDEHIRISRGPPQAFVTEGYCLGHREFVSKICLLDPNNLVSGGGDDEIFLWDWLEGKLLGKFDVKSMALQILNETTRLDAGVVSQDQKVAVSGMWTFPDSGIAKPQLLVAFEGIPALISVTHSDFLSADKAGPQPLSILRLPGNVLDVAFVRDECIIVSVDSIHRPGSTTDIDDSDEPDESEAFKEITPRLLAFTYDLENPTLFNWEADEHMNRALIDLDRQTTVSWHEKQLQALLYPMGHLRKSGAEAAED